MIAAPTKRGSGDAHSSASIDAGMIPSVDASNVTAALVDGVEEMAVNDGTRLLDVVEASYEGMAATLSSRKGELLFSVHAFVHKLMHNHGYMDFTHNLLGRLLYLGFS